ncbi:MAG: UvrD-helicase domain-containing protein [Planctomycetes bacterium]|nr:UvrD-helicase domain-containing protein [Planctomycetota bacterium]
MDAILSDLNDAQREAVLHAGGPLLVVAGAGSGKTRVITRRIAWRISQGLAPSQVLAITFTNKAAGEMKQRVEQLLGPSRAWISTFHSLGARLLRMEAEAAGLDRNFTIFDADDQLVVVRAILKQMNLGKREQRPRDLLAGISRRKTEGEEAGIAGEPAADILERVHAAYEKALAESQALDFDDLLCRSVQLLDENEEVRRRFASRFRALLIDEYQDTNRLQYRLARLIVADHDDICATGDPDQAIYRWRGADIRNILEFERDFPGTRVVKLEENYRSTNGILRAAGALIEHNLMRVERGLRSSLGEGEPVRVLAAGSEVEESARIVAGVRQALAEGARADEIAVFYRTNACSRPLEQAFRDANLPYVIVGAVEFYERREIKDLIAFLRVIANPRNAVDLARIINVPPRGIGPRTVARLKEQAEQTRQPLRDLVLAGGGGVLRAGAERALAGFAAVLQPLLALPRAPVLPLLDELLRLSAYRSFLEQEDDPLVEDRLENIAELRRAIGEYDEAHPGGTLEDFLNDTVLARSRDRDESQAPSVTLMTLHSAKGLEFPVVFIAALEEGILPHARSLASPDALEEERRLLYVGMTRARRRLSLCYSTRRAGGAPWMFGDAGPSRFLAEIPEGLVLVEGRGRSRFAPLDDLPCYEPESDGAEPPFAPGDLVVHSQFGRGRVLRVSGCGTSAKATVDFDLCGQKRLMLEYARLQKAREEC